VAAASSGVDLAVEGGAARAAAAARREATAPTLTVDAARRRIEELAALVLEQVRQQASTEAERDEARRATAAVETVLRDRLHSVVDSEISARAANASVGAADASAARAATERAAELESRVRALTQQQLEFRRQVVERVGGKDAAIASLRSEAARAKSARAKHGAVEDALRTHQKERRAITTILRDKVKVHVDNIDLVLKVRSSFLLFASTSFVCSSVLSHPRTPIDLVLKGGAGAASSSAAAAGGGGGNVLRHEVAALQRLVNASVAALENSVAGSSKGGAPSQQQQAGNGAAENRAVNAQHQQVAPATALRPRPRRSSTGSASRSLRGY